MTAVASVRHDTYDPKQWSYRAKLAGDYILRGLGGTRIFDNCFEMGDGDLVAFKIVARARKNATLATALANQGYLAGWASLYGVTHNVTLSVSDQVNALFSAMRTHPSVLADFSRHGLRLPA